MSGRPPHRGDLFLDSELNAARRILEAHPSGMTRHDLDRAFGSDRRGRKLIAAVATRGMAAVITEDAPSYAGGGKLYRLARSASEVEAERARLLAYARSLEARAAGIETAWRTGGVIGQPDLFTGDRRS